MVFTRHCSSAGESDAIAAMTGAPEKRRGRQREKRRRLEAAMCMRKGSAVA